MTGSHDSKKDYKKEKTEQLAVVQKYLAAHNITPPEYAQRFLETGNPVMLQMAMKAISTLTSKETFQFQQFLSELIKTEKFPEDATSLPTTKGHNARECLLLCCCYPLLFPDWKRFECFFKELQALSYAPAFTFWALPRIANQPNATAIKSLQKAAELGCVIALETLGNFYAKGKHGLKKNKPLALSFNQDALAQHSAVAQCYMGKQILADEKLTLSQTKGEDYLKTLKQAYDFFEMAASQGHSHAMIRLGFMHRYGLGTTQDKEKAFKIFEAVFKNPNLKYTSLENRRLAQDSASRTINSNLPWLKAVPPRDELPARKKKLVAIELNVLKPCPS